MSTWTSAKSPKTNYTFDMFPNHRLHSAFLFENSHYSGLSLRISEKQSWDMVIRFIFTVAGHSAGLRFSLRLNSRINHVKCLFLTVFLNIDEKGHEVRERSDGELKRKRSVQCNRDPTALRLDYVTSKLTTKQQISVLHPEHSECILILMQLIYICRHPGDEYYLLPWLAGRKEKPNGA